MQTLSNYVYNKKKELSRVHDKEGYINKIALGTTKGTKIPIPSLDQRKEQVRKLKLKYPDRIPILICKDPNVTSEIKEIPKHKFLVPKDITFGQLQHVVRKYVTLNSSEAIFMWCGYTQCAGSTLISQVYKEHKSLDNYLRIFFSGETCYGMTT